MTGGVVVASESSARRYALDPDVRLMLEVRDDSAAAFEELVLRYQSRLVRVLEHVVGSRDLAEDLTQEVFLRVYRSRKQYVPGAKFATWLFTIANNAALNALRNRSRRHEVQLPSRDSGSMGARPLDTNPRRQQRPDAGPATRQGGSPADGSRRHGVAGRAATAGRAALNKFEGMSYAEIAETMELSLPAVKSLLSRARENLREALEPYLQG